MSRSFPCLTHLLSSMYSALFDLYVDLVLYIDYPLEHFVRRLRRMCWKGMRGGEGETDGVNGFASALYRVVAEM